MIIIKKCQKTLHRKKERVEEDPKKEDQNRKKEIAEEDPKREDQNRKKERVEEDLKRKYLEENHLKEDLKEDLVSLLEGMFVKNVKKARLN